MEAIDGVRDCVAAGQDWDSDTRIVLFVVLREGRSLYFPPNPQHQRASGPGEPKACAGVNGRRARSPRTCSGKVTETGSAGRDRPPGAGYASALANPEALAFVAWGEATEAAGG